MIEARITPTIQDLLNEYNFESDSPVKFPNVDELVENTKDMFFDFVFPWYDMSGKEGLEDFKSLYLHKNFMKQIGQETVELHKLFLQSKLMERMPYYKQLFDTMKLEYNPLNNIDITIEENETTEGTKGSNEKTTISNETDEILNINNSISDNTHTTEEAEGTQTSSRTLTSENNEQSVTSENPEITVGDNDYTANLIRKQDGSTEDTNINANTTSGGTTDTSHEYSQSRADNRNISSSSENNVQGNINESKNRGMTLSKRGYEGKDRSELIMNYRKAIISINELIVSELNNLFLLYYGGFYL